MPRKSRRRTRDQVAADTLLIREALARLLLDHSIEHPLARQLSLKQLKDGHFPRLSIAAIAWHLAKIREAADALENV